MDSHQHPIYDLDSLPLHDDINAWDLYWSTNPQLSYGCHSWLSLHWGYSKNHDNFAYPGAHKAWLDSYQHASFLHTIHESDNEIEIGIFVWSIDFIIDLDRLLKCIHPSYVSPATIPGASWDKLHIGLNVITFNELKAPQLDLAKLNSHNSLQVCPHCPIAVYTHSPQLEHTCNMVT